MKKISLLVLFAVLLSSVAFAAPEREESYTNLTTAQKDQLNRLGSPSTTASANKVELGNLLDDLVDGTVQIRTWNATSAPASGASSGAIMALHDARTSVDCGNVGGGAVLNVCVSDGTNWVNLN